MDDDAPTGGAVKSPDPRAERGGASGGKRCTAENAARERAERSPQGPPAFWMEAYLEQYGAKG